ncbi:hypothetical protein D3C81_319020 [compost metagenome]
MIAASQPATAIERITARGFKPNACARSADISNIAEAPSDKAEDVAAVTVPPFGSNTGRNALNDSRFASGRITSSMSQRILKPFAS